MRVARKEEALEALVARMLEKDREELEDAMRKARAMTAELKRKETAFEKESRRVRDLDGELQALRGKLDARERTLEAREADLDKQRDETRRMREQLEALL